MKKKLVLFFIFFPMVFLLHAQGHIEHIKNQKYLNLARQVDCSKAEGDNLSQKICINLDFQKSDSSLVVIYNDLLKISNDRGDKALQAKIAALQQEWRKLRDQHCAIIYDLSKGCGGCNEQAIAYLSCLKEMTDSRILELQKLRRELP